MCWGFFALLFLANVFGQNQFLTTLDVYLNFKNITGYCFNSFHMQSKMKNNKSFSTEKLTAKGLQTLRKHWQN